MFKAELYLLTKTSIIRTKVDINMPTASIDMIPYTVLKFKLKCAIFSVLSSPVQLFDPEYCLVIRCITPISKSRKTLKD